MRACGRCAHMNLAGAMHARGDELWVVRQESRYVSQITWSELMSELGPASDDET